MELAIPGLALGLFYVVSKQNNTQENFENDDDLPNTNVPNRNFPSEQPVESVETDHTNQISVNNKYDNSNGTYTDKYFDNVNKNSNSNNFDNCVDNIKKDTEYYSLTGQKVSSDYFCHNNMTPYFGSNVTTANTDSSSYESVLDNYAGSGSQHIEKDSQAPLFTPSENLQWTNGAPNSTEFIRSRINPSMRMANVKPFKDEQVAPGLGNSEKGSEGFNSGMMARELWMPKNVDELRVDNNKKNGGTSILGHQGPATAYNKKISNKDNIGIMEKHRPERMFEQNQDRFLTTTGIKKEQPIRSVHINKNVSRPDTTTQYTGVASGHIEAPYIPGEYKPSQNQQLGSLPLGVANANGRNYAHDHDYDIKAKKAYPNNRTSNKNEGYFGAVSGSLGAVVSPMLDMLKPSRKENAVGTLRPYQNPGTVVSETYIFDPNDKLPTTMRETTENSKFHMNVNRNKIGGAYQVTENQVADTNRHDTGNFFYAGNAGATPGTTQSTSYESSYNQRNNDIKSSTIQGYMVKGNMKLLNNEINMHNNDKDAMLHNKRDITGGMSYNTPDASHMGRLAGQEKKSANTITKERHDTHDITSMLKSNPYVVDFKNAL
jgi:hypothetical protein